MKKKELSKECCEERICMIPFPFEGAVNKVKLSKKEKKKIKQRGKIKCSCGAIDKYWTALPSFHDSDCIINTRSNK